MLSAEGGSKILSPSSIPNLPNKSNNINFKMKPMNNLLNYTSHNS